MYHSDLQRGQTIVPEVPARPATRTSCLLITTPPIRRNRHAPGTRAGPAGRQSAANGTGLVGGWSGKHRHRCERQLPERPDTLRDAGPVAPAEPVAESRRSRHCFILWSSRTRAGGRISGTGGWTYGQLLGILLEIPHPLRGGPDQSPGVFLILGCGYPGRWYERGSDPDRQWDTMPCRFGLDIFSPANPGSSSTPNAGFLGSYFIPATTPNAYPTFSSAFVWATILQFTLTATTLTRPLRTILPITICWRAVPLEARDDRSETEPLASELPVARPAESTKRASPSQVPRPVSFTLVELLVVITIILIVSAVALPTVLPALSHRQVSEAARILQAALPAPGFGHQEQSTERHQIVARSGFQRRQSQHRLF